MQQFTSASTSINSKKAPAIYGMKKAQDVMLFANVLDIGGGKYDTAQEVANSYGATVTVYDPYNRTEEHNKEALSFDNYHVSVISNVLNVINDQDARKDVLQLAASKAENILITVYEGDGSGCGKQTGADSWQENRKTADYVPEIAAALPGYQVQRFGKLIICKKFHFAY